MKAYYRIFIEDQYLLLLLKHEKCIEENPNYYLRLRLSKWKRIILFNL